MNYLIVAQVDGQDRPIKINTADTSEAAADLVTRLHDMGYNDAFYTDHPGTEAMAYVTADVANKTVSYNSSQHAIDVLLPKIAAYRYEIETGGITVDGVSVQTDRETQSKIMAARIKAQEDSTYSTKWKTPDGFVTLDASQILTIADAVHNHVQAAFETEATVEDEIKNGTLTTINDVKTRFDELMG